MAGAWSVPGAAITACGCWALLLERREAALRHRALRCGCWRTTSWTLSSSTRSSTWCSRCCWWPSLYTSWTTWTRTTWTSWTASLLEETYNMAAPPAPTGGTIPLTEYRRDVPPGWSPGDSGYTLRSYLEKLRLWYRICSLEDEHVGLAMQLRVPRPDGNVDQGDAALVRLPVDEVLECSSW